MIDKTVLRKAAKGDRRAQFLLYKDVHACLFPVTCRYFSNDDERAAALNKGFMKILDSLKRFLKENDADRFEFWAKRVVINSCIDELRSQKRIKEQTRTTDWQEESYMLDDHHVNEAEQKLNAEDLQGILHQLGDTRRAVFNLYAVEGYSHKEIADKLEISEDNSRYHLSMARKDLKSMVIKAMGSLKSFLL
ncbi:MAG: RNA polymerase sigma factor [Flavobacteriales bacterium]|nr:RNA polymerase sigma factor [Flavobacteriales bacterium]